MIDLAFLSSFGGNLAALGVAAGTYMAYKLLRRFRCQSHTRCCDVELVKPETERGRMDEPRILDLIKSLANKQENYAGPEPWRADKVPVDHARGPQRQEGQAKPVRALD